MAKPKNKTIIFSGGGTLGPVMPLLDIVSYYKKRGDYNIIWVGTNSGPEKDIIKHISDIKFISIDSGKIRRGLSWSNISKNIFDIFHIYYGFRQSKSIIKKYQPEWVISAGAYVSVPLHFAAKRMGISSWVHQLDLEIGLANKIMIPWASKVTTMLPPDIYKLNHIDNKIIDSSFSLMQEPIDYSNIYRQVYNEDLRSGSSYEQVLGIINNIYNHVNIINDVKDKMNIFILGGGTGSLFINDMVRFLLDNIDSNIEIYHITGYGKYYTQFLKLSKKYNNYHPLEFVDKDIEKYYEKADLIISRAGMGTIANIIKYQKYSILIPLPGHQIYNALYMKDKGASIMIKQDIKYA